ncbi:vWA domain-containing protein [Actinosynnema sp. NPDC047251]|uniref:von Willebrand factor type A family protein n=1 Tax=Saccharothrix espanaensis (strain ATCC 51144 / DSM 44229 / JCM 9112 / NBRC 15066 / NRRL 15764) TaxID=1179773 RepID=K0JQ88_SACES|nr:vWA domain-containing protein [Saccharothrix espanaensis]CCH27746.1 von Willebrand factor type A family protein [Saccharothrix espanaensis DSM 44229]
MQRIRRPALTVLAAFALAASVTQVVSPAGAAPAPTAPRKCGPMDVVFVVDDTGSMGGAITNLKTGINQIAQEVENLTGFDYRLGLATFKDNVTVVDNFAPNNRTPVIASVNALAASGGGNEPEASDEALNTVVNNLPAAGRPQNVDFAVGWRSNATKLAVLITDARPGGFDDDYDTTPANVDATNAALRATQALSKGIKVSSVYVPTSGGLTSTIVPIMQNYATTTGGLYTQAQADGSGVSTAVIDFLRDCKRSDVFIKDQGVDTGAEPNPNSLFWNSPDIKVCPGLADCGPGIQPVVGQANYIHVRLNNPGPNATANGFGTLKVYRTTPGGSTNWDPVTNGDWTYIGEETLSVPVGGVTVAKVLWSPVPGPGHFCLLARWVSASDPMTFPETANTSLNTQRNNNIAWRNYQTVRATPKAPGKSWFAVGNATGRPIKTDLVVTSPDRPLVGNGRVVIDLGPRLVELWRSTGARAEGVKQVGETQFEIADPKRAAFLGIPVQPGERHTTELTFTAGTQLGQFVQHVVQLAEGQDIGGVGYGITVDRG